MDFSMKNVKNAFFGKIKQFNKLKRNFYLFINSSDDAKILLRHQASRLLVRQNNWMPILGPISNFT
jgi:hypothetical protein